MTQSCYEKQQYEKQKYMKNTTILIRVLNVHILNVHTPSKTRVHDNIIKNTIAWPDVPTRIQIKQY